jgi:drug/metabolite transporter (DMT)-like permease
MSSSAPRTTALSPQAFATLLLLACMMAGNHVAARIAMDNGVDVITAVASRSAVTALVVALIVVAMRVKVQMNPRQRWMMLLIGTLVALQSAWLYSAVARLPVGLALLAFNTYPLWAAFWAWALYRHRPERAVLVAMPVILFGLALALDVAGAASGLGAQGQWARISAGAGFATAAAATFGLILVLTQHEVAALDGRFRSALSMGIVAVLTFAVAGTQTGLHWPQAPAGWWGLAALTFLYGTGFTVMFTLLPKLGVVGSSPIMNVEPVAALLLAWPILGQAMAPVQWLGAVLVVGTVMVLGLRKR